MDLDAFSNTGVSPLLILAEVASGQEKIKLGDGHVTQQQTETEVKVKMEEATEEQKESDEPLPPPTSHKTVEDSAQPGPSSPITASGTPKISKRRRAKYAPILPRPPPGNIILIPKPAPPPNPTSAKKFTCNVCQRAYTRETYLKAHQLSHQGVRQHACAWIGCTRTFVRKDQLARHTRVHTGERNHHCTLCNFSFRRSDHLLKHIRTQHNSGLRRSMRRRPTKRTP